MGYHCVILSFEPVVRAQIQGWLRGVLRNGIVLAKKMNRILVLPVLECYCERYHGPQFRVLASPLLCSTPAR